MHATRAARGVYGFFPFLKKHAPGAFLPIAPHTDLAHARIAIDATLLTQKFVYSEHASDARHLAGLSNVVHTLRTVGAVPIMVFDHPTERLPQKRATNEKRAAQRTLRAFRHAVEQERSARVHTLADTVCAYDALDESTKRATSAAVRGTAHAVPQAAARLAATVRELRAAYEAQHAWIAAQAPLAESATQRALHAAEAGVYAALADACVDGTQTLLVCLPAEVRGVPATSTAAWLSKRSAELCAAYARSTRVVTDAMYREGIALCRRLHVPVLVVGDGEARAAEASDVHEAEGFASALVRASYADMVASEDSDVLLYHVPLLRGLGARQASCELVDAARVRAALFPEPGVPEAEADDARRAMLVQYALLCGTDFNRTIPGLGPVGAYRAVCRYGTAERILAHTAHVPPMPPDAYLAHLADAARVFERPPAVAAAAEAAGLTRGARDAPGETPPRRGI
ncbi:hypothetical protein MBRA1_002692 [Malassezia brasiliensis]|uniref:XPG-I domain-containing protein n=1 Tax=Malassezia brasiliensis TaxID=1821822 RepID=A0AAF0DUK5_9BASI|nr:hypothetical protein MBRA1_002692 [Malassezia brasiliensis]